VLALRGLMRVDDEESLQSNTRKYSTSVVCGVCVCVCVAVLRSSTPCSDVPETRSVLFSSKTTTVWWLVVAGDHGHGKVCSEVQTGRRQ
jgi:hypothetical protein